MTSVTLEPAPNTDSLLATYVRGRDVPCPVCRYNLRNTSSQRCPECGTQLELNVGTPTPRIGAWTLSMIASAMPLGFAGTLLAVGVIQWRRSSFWGNTDTYAALALSAYVAVWLTTVVTLYLLRGRFNRWRPIMRWIVTAAVLVSAAGANASLVFIFAKLFP